MQALGGKSRRPMWILRRAPQAAERPDNSASVGALDQDVSRAAAGAPLDQDDDGLAALEVRLADHAPLPYQ
jgi:hypothetical protein